MTHDPADPSEPEGPRGSLQPTSPRALTIWGLLGLVGGWLFHAYAERQMTVAPVVTWSQPLALFLVAAILGVTAWATWRIVHVRRLRLLPHQAVNRLVLAKACAIAGALLAGGYFGYALSWIGEDSELAQERMLHSLLAGVAGVLIVAGSLALERACRVRSRLK